MNDAKMAAPISKKEKRPSKIVKPKKTARRTTTSTKNHRFQSFTERISNLKIDPIRRRRNAEEQDKLNEEADSYFGRSLESWRDLNLSRNFTAFAKDVTNLCDNLAVVLHNEEKIMDLLVEYIGKGDSLAIEPLLSLLSHFARDLDIRFEKHFPRAVTTVTSIAAIHEDPAVVEWCFNSLAWLFKYLSRVLTPDLRPLFDLMSPYLGQSKQKPFVVRFAAESLSFLIRKAAAVYERDCTPLENIMGHILQECCTTSVLPGPDLFKQGIMTLLSDAAAGVGDGLHSTGPAIIHCCLQQCEKEPGAHMGSRFELIRGAITSLIHHCTADNFSPILVIVLGRARLACESTDTALIDPYCHLLFTIAVVRKGSRVVDWKAFLGVLREFVELDKDNSNTDSTLKPSILSALAVALQSAPINEVLPSLDLLTVLRQGEWALHFLQFSDLFARLGKERFQTFLLPEFRKFVLEQWSQYQNTILTLLPWLGLSSQQIVCPFTDLEGPWTKLLPNPRSRNSTVDSTQLHSLNALLSGLAYVKIGADVKESFENRVLDFVIFILQKKDGVSQDSRDFALGACFNTLLQMNGRRQSIKSLWPQLCLQAPDFVSMPVFWTNLERYLQMASLDGEAMSGKHIEVLQDALLQCLTSPSHDIRESALKILERLYSIQNCQVPAILSTAILIESTPVTLEASRSISMHIRKLGQSFHNESDSLVQRAIARYCFGLLHLKLASAWDDAVKALTEMSKVEVGQETITILSQQWLEGESLESDVDGSDTVDFVLDIDSKGFSVASDFECPNLTKLSAISEQVFQSPNQGYPAPEQAFLHKHSKTPLLSADTRAQALRVLNKIPNIAEKKSRMLVPVLLSWASLHAPNSENLDPSYRWSRKDQKAMLQVFAQFINPRVLFQSGEVYKALLDLCANGDVEIQRSALKAILAWKEAPLVQLEERLTNLLDEARFRDEVAVFLHGGNDEVAIDIASQSVLMPVLLRLLYGRAVAGGKEGQRARRRTIFVALSTLGVETVDMFVDISLASAGVASLDSSTSLQQALSMVPIPAARQQFGMLNMFDDLLETLGPKVEVSAQKVMNAVLTSTVSAARQLGSVNEAKVTDDSLLRSVRQVGMQCLSKLFAAMQKSDFNTQARIVANELLLPRLANFAAENTQSVSGTLLLLSAWSVTPPIAKYLIEDTGQIVHALGDLLRHPSAKDPVRLFVLREIVDNILDDQTLLPESQITVLVCGIGELIDLQQSQAVLDACVVSLTKIAGLISKPNEAEQVKAVCASLLTKPGKLVSSSTKVGLLKTLSPLISRFETSDPSRLYDSLCGLFSRMRDDRNRNLLSEVFAQLCSSRTDLKNVAEICMDINTLGSRLDEPDLERREQGFVNIFEQSQLLSVEQWLPIVHNCLFFIRDSEDMVNRSNAARSLDRLVDAAAINSGQFDSLITKVVLPAIEHGMSDPSELVRAEYTLLLGHIIEKLQYLGKIKDLVPLTVDGDGEASFFANILHIQQHRRLRALRRLADESEHLGSSNINEFFIPLLEHFVFDSVEGPDGQALANETVSTLGSLAKALKWSSFRHLFKRYSRLLKSQPDNEKVTLRLLRALVDAMHSGQCATKGIEVDATKQDRSEIIEREFLPPLVAYLHLKDESTVDRRMPVAVSIVKLLQSLPEQELSSRLPPVLTDVCHVLRSRSVDARDQTREALAEISKLIGPSYFGFLLKELRGALQRGYQLHVLGYTVHDLLGKHSKQLQPGDLDHCLSDLVAVVMDDIFGVTGQEKEAEEYKSSMKEIKSSKSFDTMELLAKSTPVKQLGRLIKPISALLAEKLNSTATDNVDKLIRRLRKGVEQNPEAESRDLLVFCHEVIRLMYTTPQLGGPRDNNGFIGLEKPSKTKGQTSPTAQMFKLVSFALTLLREVLHRHKDLLTVEKVRGFLPMIGDALVQGQKEIQQSAMALLSTIMSLQMKELDDNAPVYFKEAKLILLAEPNMATNSGKAALKLVTAVLREKREVTIRGKDVGDILKFLKHEIDQPEREDDVYKFLRAVIGRKVVVAELYDIMDEVGQVLVTNPDQNVREGGRSAYIRFIMDYPHGKGRWNKQMGSITANLQYKTAAGRQSTMDLLFQILEKVSNALFEEIAWNTFVALIPVLVSDEDRGCQRKAEKLIAKILERSDSDLYEKITTYLLMWLGNEDKITIQVAGLQCWQIVLRTRPPSPEHLQSLLQELQNALERHGDLSSGDTYVTSNALETFEVLLETMRTHALSKDAAGIWERLQDTAKSSSGDSQLITARLLEQYFTDLATTSSKLPEGLSAVPLRGSGGLELSTESMRKLCYASIKTLLTANGESHDQLIPQSTLNLKFLGRCFAANAILWRAVPEDASDDDESAKDRDPSAIAYLLNRLSYVARQDNVYVLSRIAALDVQMSLINRVEIFDIDSMIRPAYMITDTTIPREAVENQSQEKLREKATELLDVLQKKLGTEFYLSSLGRVRKETKARREERRRKRRIEAVAAPERAAREKKRKHDARKATLKERGLQARGKRRGW